MRSFALLPVVLSFIQNLVDALPDSRRPELDSGANHPYPRRPELDSGSTILLLNDRMTRESRSYC